MRVFYNHDFGFELIEPEYALMKEGKFWNDPQWKVLPSRLCPFLAHFTELVPMRDVRQNFLAEDLLDHFDDGALCRASMFLDRGAEPPCLLQDNSSAIEAHILPRKFTTQLPVQTLRKIDPFSMNSEASVRESTDSRIIELIP